MTTNNVVSLKAVREIKEADDLAYQANILRMSKVELLEEMVRFQEERTKIGELTPAMMLKGKHLFKALEENAETEELRILTRAYRRHLEFELLEYTRKKRNSELGFLSKADSE